jgi:TIR domain
MAKIYISYQRDDQPFVVELTNRLKTAGHILSYDVDELSPGTDWRTALDTGLKQSEIFIVILSNNTQRSQYVLTEVGAARAYSLESNRMLLVPIVIDDLTLPLSIQDIHAIIQPDRNLEEIIPKIERAISAFIGRRAAIESAASEAAEKIQSNAADYIRVAIDSLDKLERRDRLFSYIWYFLGFISLLLGIAFALRGLAIVGQQTEMQIGNLILVVLKAIVVIGLLGACAKYAFSLGKSYSNESLKSSDRIHAIRFGEFYLGAFGDKTKWEELKEVFQHWNIDRNSSFSFLDVSQFDPKILESLTDLIKAIGGNKDDKQK